MSLRIRSLSVAGFRAYGVDEQVLNLPSDLAAVWGPNSKGKTSLAEALEFLLTGEISRRELMASAQDEFAEALRNVYLSPSDEVYVSAGLEIGGGDTVDVKRVLLRDYGKREDCASRILIDERDADQAALESLGLRLSQPPLRAPVLAQHTLADIFSVRPQDRSTYFKTILEVADLDVLLAAVAALPIRILQRPPAPCWSGSTDAWATPA